MEPDFLQGRDFINEFIISASRSSGAGGQNVNKVSTKVEIRFHGGEAQHLGGLGIDAVLPIRDCACLDIRQAGRTNGRLHFRGKVRK